MEFDNSDKKLSSKELIKIYEEYKPTTELMKLKFRDYGKDGIELLKKLHNLENDRS
jgi:hypothetical protein